MTAADVAARLKGGGARTKFDTYPADCPKCGEAGAIYLSDVDDGAVLVERNCHCTETAVRDAATAELDGKDVELLTPADKRMRERAKTNGHAKGKGQGKPNGGAREPAGVVIRAASSYALKQIDWLWPHWLARGKLHILGFCWADAMLHAPVKPIATAAAVRAQTKRRIQIVMPRP